MKTWIEYSSNIEDYYEWIPKENNLIFEKMSVFSLNASGIISNVDEFYQYCINELHRTLIYPENYNIYIIVNEKIKNANSKVEHYKKCWKRVSSEFDISKLELGQEVGYVYDGQFFYAGIAKTSILNMIDIMKIVNAKPNKCILFASKNNYLEKPYSDKNFIETYIAYNQYGDIDYSKCFAQCCLKHEIGIRYGTSYSEAELALIFNRYDRDIILNPRTMEYSKAQIR